jgi:hypothetical protein
VRSILSEEALVEVTAASRELSAINALPNLWKVVCKCTSDALNDRHQVELVETLP